MARDVDTALHRIVETHGNQSAEEARAYIDAMKKDK
jgi:sulfite reductase alpha subunit-like flavoprotein